MTQLIELDSMNTVAEHGNLWNTPHNQIRRKIGRFTTVHCGGADGGTVRDLQGKCWDWWTDQQGKLTILEAR